ncbi:MAG: hypothetical protein GY870_08090 [archaeon]|nr:hypothetical protein [archaeon]
MKTSKLLPMVMENIKNSNTKICIGMGNNPEQNYKIREICEKFSKKFKKILLIFGNTNIYSSKKVLDDFNSINFNYEKQNIDFLNENIFKKIKKFKENGGIVHIFCEKPEKVMLSLIFSKNRYSGIRGSLSSSNFLRELKSITYKIDNKSINFSRIALMETFEGYQFFYAPVGIDEANTIEKKKQLIFNFREICKVLKIPLKISTLSGGRIGDIGRDNQVDKTIKDSETIKEFFSRKEFSDIKIFNHQILIEEAIKNESSFILAPDGISGNLIYRTLVHLGGGKAYGAIYSSIFLNFKKTIIDCSRVAKESEIFGSLIMASSLN